MTDADLDHLGRVLVVGLLVLAAASIWWNAGRSE